LWDVVGTAPMDMANLGHAATFQTKKTLMLLREWSFHTILCQ
jgi:hypothetical protein